MPRQLETVFETRVYQNDDGPYNLSSLVNRQVEEMRNELRSFELISVSTAYHPGQNRWYATVAYSYSKWFDYSV